MSKLGMTTTIIATNLAQAITNDEQGDGCDIPAGLFGSELSKLVRELAKNLVEKDERIAELAEDNEQLKQRIKDTYNYCESVRKSLPIHNLEQQAKGIEDALECFQSSYEDTKVYVSDLTSRIQKLREQAKQLNGGAE